MQHNVNQSILHCAAVVNSFEKAVQISALYDLFDWGFLAEYAVDQLVDIGLDFGVVVDWDHNIGQH